MDDNKFLESTIKVDDFLNHSCNPNCYIDFSSLNLIAMKNIKRGEELTINYNTFEYDLINLIQRLDFHCNCNSKNCYKEVKGFRYLPLKEKLRLRKFLSPFLKRKLKEELSQK